MGEGIRGLDESREFPCRKISNDTHLIPDNAGLLLPQFLCNIQPPNEIRSPQGVNTFIRCLPFQKTRTKENMWLTPEFTVRVRKGRASEHALLHFSILNSLKNMSTAFSFEPFVCVGTTHTREPWMWIMTFEERKLGDEEAGETEDGNRKTKRQAKPKEEKTVDVVFYESSKTNGVGYGAMFIPLKDRFADPEYAVTIINKEESVGNCLDKTTAQETEFRCWLATREKGEGDKSSTVDVNLDIEVHRSDKS